MATGTLSLTKNSLSVTGSGTKFTSELKAGDFIYTTIEGVNYTLGVDSISSDTVLNLAVKFNGNTTQNQAFTAIPRQAMVGITAQLAADTARAIRALNFDKANWQQVLSGTGNVSVTLPDGSVYSGPSWGGISKDLEGKASTKDLEGKASKGKNNDISELSGLTTPLSVSQGGTGAGNVTDALKSLGLSNSFNQNQAMLPGGLIIKYGIVNSSVNAVSKDTIAPHINFENPFPNACFGCVACLDNNGGGANSCTASAISKNGFTAEIFTNYDGWTPKISYIAIGY